MKRRTSENHGGAVLLTQKSFRELHFGADALLHKCAGPRDRCERCRERRAWLADGRSARVTELFKQRKPVPLGLLPSYFSDDAQPV